MCALLEHLAQERRLASGRARIIIRFSLILMPICLTTVTTWDLATGSVTHFIMVLEKNCLREKDEDKGTPSGMEKDLFS